MGENKMIKLTDILIEMVQNKALTDVKNVAEEFYQFVKTKYPNAPLGHSSSGNCAWTALFFKEWADKKYPGKTKILMFIEPYKSWDAHVVPVYDENIIDYIQIFTKNKPYKIHKVIDNTIGKVQKVEKAGLGYFKEWYNRYILEKDQSGLESNKELKNVYNKMYSTKEKFKLSTFCEPQISKK
jgi:hypothetical protein